MPPDRTMHPYSRKLLRSPAAFEALVGASVATFADLVEDIRPAFDAAELKRKVRPPHGLPSNRGRLPALGLGDGTIVVLLFARFPLDWAVGRLFGVSVMTVRRSARRLLPLLRTSTAAVPLAPLGAAEGRPCLVRAVRALPECADPFAWFCHMGSACGVWVSVDGNGFASAEELNAHMRALYERPISTRREPAA